MRVARALVVALFAFGVSAASADAALITLNYDFSASGFSPEGAPVDSVTGTFGVTFDNASGLANVTTGLSVTHLNISLGSAAAFSYFTASDTLLVGGFASGANGISPAGDDFVLAIQGVSTTPAFFLFVYAQQADTFATNSGTLTAATPVPVPEPASLTLLGFGLASIGVRRWRQRKA